MGKITFLRSGHMNPQNWKWLHNTVELYNNVLNVFILKYNEFLADYLVFWVQPSYLLAGFASHLTDTSPLCLTDCSFSSCTFAYDCAGIMSAISHSPSTNTKRKHTHPRAYSGAYSIFSKYQTLETISVYKGLLYLFSFNIKGEHTHTYISSNSIIVINTGESLEFT